jgi:(E)-4-hydroxy-3-methylbut-2-enyl-diphosphate synthase
MTGFRRKTKVVTIGGIPLGGDYPVRIQSMTNTNTLDTEATVRQIIDLSNAGADYVRMTVRSTKEAENLSEIKKSLLSQGIKTPLVADVHFNPAIAEIAARIVEKVRINPGNYSESKQQKDFSAEQFALDYEILRDKFRSLLKICKAHGTALRIGVNHGSLSQRMVSKFGDTPAGMVESAMEFLRICEEEKFQQIVISLKSSNTRMMVLANQMMVAEMDRHDMNYPLHLGVTEAGNDEDGRIKSAAGIGLLLAQGIGDTIRVSLTEDPVKEIPVTKKLVAYYSGMTIGEKEGSMDSIQPKVFEFRKRISRKVEEIGGEQVPVVIADLSVFEETRNILFKNKDQTPEFVYAGDKIASKYNLIWDYHKWLEEPENAQKCFPLLTYGEYLTKSKKSPRINFVEISESVITGDFVESISSDQSIILVLNSEEESGYHGQKRAFEKLNQLNCDVPVIIKRKYDEADTESFMIKAAADVGGLFIEGFGDGIWIAAGKEIHAEVVNSVSFSVLQASRARISKTEFISCPSCGRTQFDLEEVTNRIKKRTSHLKGLKIAIMGCFVNGPGEMADADYGYVGGGKGKVNLYKGHQLVKKDIPEDRSIEDLIELIKDSGDWTEPK